jgi:chaperonin GroEL
MPAKSSVVASVTRISRITNRARFAGIGTSSTTEKAVVEKPAEEDEHAGHHHGHAH